MDSSEIRECFDGMVEALKEIDRAIELGAGRAWEAMQKGLTTEQVESIRVAHGMGSLIGARNKIIDDLKGISGALAEETMEALRAGRNNT